MHLKATALGIQKQVLAPFARQSIEILLLPHLDLATAIEQEIQENPLLEAVQDPERADEDLQIKLNSLTSLPIPAFETETTEDQEGGAPGPAERPLSLADFLTRQLRLELADPRMLVIGEFIIENLDECGFLPITVSEISQELGISDQALVAQTLDTIQHLEPVGIAASNIRESLCIQLMSLSNAYAPLAVLLVKDHFEDVGRKRFSAIARKLRLPLEDVLKAVELLSLANPCPARNYQNNSQTVYAYPDVHISKDAWGQYTIEVNRHSIPSLRINQFYCQLMKKENIPAAEKSFIRERITRALDFMKSVQQRGTTLREISRFILERQKGFFDNPDGTLLPMTLKDVARQLRRNESTISRAVSHKFLDTPRGLLPFKFFFSQAVCAEQDAQVSAQAVQEEIAHLIEDEDKNAPLSDQQVQTYFAQKGIKLARRTINKYRQVLNIPPAHQRKTDAIGKNRLAGV